jgi:hypothetical protein
MVVPSIKTRRNVLSIIVLAAIIFIVGMLLIHIANPNSRDKIADGVLADFVITFPTLYYFIIIRPLKTSAKRILIVISVCSLIAYLVLPQHQKNYILQLRKLTALAELVFIGYAITNLNRLRKFYKIHKEKLPDPIFNLRFAMADALGESLAVKVVASELSILRYGLLFWKKEASGLKESKNFTTHKETGYIAVWCILIVAILVEISAFHLLLLKWSHVAAMVVTILSLYGVIFFIADLSAILKRKVQMNNEYLLLRTGLRWRVKTSLNNINAIKKITGDYQSDDAYFKGGIIKNSGNLLISFKAPVQVDKLYGASKEFSTILMNIDDYDAFAKAIELFR